MDTKNFTVKRQVVQLFTALSLYSLDGYDTCLNSLQHYKVCNFTTVDLEIFKQFDISP